MNVYIDRLMSDWTDDEIKGKILHKLVRCGKFEHSHTAIENLQKGFPKDLTGDVQEMIEALKKEGVLIWRIAQIMLHNWRNSPIEKCAPIITQIAHFSIPKKTSYGEQVSINVGLNELVMKYIESFLKRSG